MNKHHFDKNGLVVATVGMRIMLSFHQNINSAEASTQQVHTNANNEGEAYSPQVTTIAAKQANDIGREHDP